MYERFAEYYDRWMDDVDTEQWAIYLLNLFEQYGQLGEISILDTACGTGNISIPLAQMGCQLMGCDISDDMLRIAKEKARIKGVRIPLIRQNMIDIQLSKPVDVINCSCDGVNYLIDDGDAFAFFESANRALRADGLLSFDISSAYKIREQLDGCCFGEDEDDFTYLWQNAYDPKTHLLEMYVTWFVEKEKEENLFERYSELHIQRAYEMDELDELLHKAGFLNIKHYGDFSTNEPTEETERIFFIAQKK